MAFINEWVKVDDRVEYNIPEYGKYTPTTWTIDKERNIVLFEYADGGEYMPDVIRFALIVDNEVFCYEMIRIITGDDILWETVITTTPINFEVNKILEEALIVFGDSGSPFEHLENVHVNILY